MADISLRLYARDYLGGQVKKLKKELGRAKTAEDIEGIHKSRVATRRIRSGLNFFDKCFNPKTVKNWQREIQQLTKSLGGARDCDVQMEFIKKVISELTDEQQDNKTGLNRFLLRLVQKRQSLQPGVIESIDKFKSKKVLKSMSGDLKRISADHKPKKEDFQSRIVFQHSSKLINKKVKKLMSYESSLEDPSDIVSHHKMRIATKKLRYTMEICNTVFDKKLDDIIKTVKRIQTYLGDIHDRDVWQIHIKDFIEREKEYTREYYGQLRGFSRIEKGLIFLHDDCVEKRKLLFSEFVDYWKKCKQENLWSDLSSLINSHVQKYAAK